LTKNDTKIPFGFQAKRDLQASGVKGGDV